MICRTGGLRCKEVKNVRDGTKLEYMDDIELHCASAGVTALVIFVKSRLFGLLGRCGDLVIPWGCIEIMGEDIILVKGVFRCAEKGKKSRGERLRDRF